MLDLDELLRIREAATPGPWEHKIDDAFTTIRTIEPSVASYVSPADAAYIVAACNAIPELVARIRELKEQVTFLNHVTVNLAHNSCLTCVDNPHGCPREFYSHDNDDIENVLVCCRVRHAWRDAKIHMLVGGKVFMGSQKCPTLETPCHARNGELCMSDNHISCAQAVNEDSFIMRRFTEVK